VWVFLEMETMCVHVWICRCVMESRLVMSRSTYAYGDESDKSLAFFSVFPFVGNTAGRRKDKNDTSEGFLLESRCVIAV
jgi:hypothetical protein